MDCRSEELTFLRILPTSSSSVAANQLSYINSP